MSPKSPVRMPDPIEELPRGAATPALAEITGRERPLLIRGLVDTWPAVQWARESDMAFARNLAQYDNGAPVDALLMPVEAEGIVGYSEDFERFNYDHHRVSVTRVLKRLLLLAREQRPIGLAMQSAPVERCLPGLLNTHALPLLEPAIQPRLWVGNRVTTPAHYDEFHNIACVTCGRRRFTLFPPEQVGNLYVGPLDFAPTGAAMSLARLDRPDDPRFPRLREALAHASVAELAPGDALYIPPMWWHHVASLTAMNALVNYWWKPVRRGGYAPETSLGGLLHCILAFRSLSDGERRAWRVMLDHYVFGDEDAGAHIPAHRRGILGPLDPETAARLRETVKRYL